MLLSSSKIIKNYKPSEKFHKYKVYRFIKKWREREIPITKYCPFNLNHINSTFLFISALNMVGSYRFGIKLLSDINLIRTHVF